MNVSAAHRDRIEAIVGSFVVRYRAGERPSIEHYAQLHPDVALG